MLFSILIPVYNCEKYLRDCLDSVYKQSFTDFEVVIVDDGSRDNSGRIADEYELEHKNTLVLHEVNQGPFLARREGLHKCSGDYVVFLDSDDRLSPDALAKIKEAIDQTDADIVSFRFSKNSSFSTADDVAYIPDGIYMGSEYEVFKRAICSARSNSLWGKAIRLRCVNLDKSCKNLEGSMFAEDLLQLLPIVDSSKSFVRIGDVLYFYRPNEGGSTSSFKDKYIDNTEQVAASLLEYGTRWGMTDAALSGVSRLYICLSKILADSIGGSLSNAEAKDKLARMRDSLLSVCPNIADGFSSLRFDQRALLGAVIKADLSRLRLVTFMSHLGRRVLGRSV